MKEPMFRNRKPPQSTYGPDDYTRTGAMERLRQLGQDDEANAILGCTDYEPEVGSAASPEEILELWEELDADI